MIGIGERNSVQEPVVRQLASIGWNHIYGEALDRELEDVMIEADLRDALIRLNPVIAQDPSRAAEIIAAINRDLALPDDGTPVTANQAFYPWLRGLHTWKFTGTTKDVPITLFDFTEPAANRFVVADEVTFPGTRQNRRLDIVLYVNGIPLVVGETKSPVGASRSVSWYRGAKDIANTYELECPAFFRPNVLSFATEGRELAYAPLGTRPEDWQVWGANKGRLEDVLANATQLLAPATILSILADYTLYERPDTESRIDKIKIIPRYMQHAAVQLMHQRALDPARNRGLIVHTQGTGKTLAMVFAAGILLQEPALQNPTVVMIADRLQLVRQMWDQFHATGMPRLQVAESASQLRSLLADQAHGGTDQRGLIFTTVHKFAGIGEAINERANVFVMVDEAHRTQEGSLGQSMRAALPNATMFGFTGTPIADADRNTFDVFGDEGDPGRALHEYTSEQGVADGVVVPIHVAPRLVEFHLDKKTLDESFRQLKDAEGLTDDQAEVLSSRATRVATFFTSPQRVRAVAADMVDHFYSTVDPLDMGAQVVAFNREACVAYYEEITRLLNERAARLGLKIPDEAAVVMSVGTVKGEDPAWSAYHLTETQEEALLNRFRDVNDPLKFLIVTSKLGTGFNAPIEGVMYLDKPMKLHTLFQTITRTNRTWTNPRTGQAKRYGLVVDYVGLGDGFARAMSPANPEQGRREHDIDGLIEKFETQLRDTRKRFNGISMDTVDHTTLLEVEKRFPTAEDVEEFAVEYGMLHGIWETLYPDLRLEPYKTTYRFLTRVYQVLQPSGAADDLLWARLGTKTTALVHEALTGFRIDHDRPAVVVSDADTLRRLRDEGFEREVQEFEGKSADEVIDSIAARLKRRLAAGTGKNEAKFASLAERLDRLRERQLTAAQEAFDWLRELFGVAKDLTAAEKADDAGVESSLPDPRIGALTQIFREYAPENTPAMIERVVLEVDAIVKQTTADDSGWMHTNAGDRAVRQALRKTLAHYELHDVTGLFDAAYEYIAEHY